MQTSGVGAMAGVSLPARERQAQFNSLCFQYFESMGPRRGGELNPCLIYSRVRNLGMRLDVLGNS